MHNNVSKQVHSTIGNQGDHVQNVCNAVYVKNVKVPNIQTCSGVNHVAIEGVNHNETVNKVMCEIDTNVSQET